MKKDYWLHRISHESEASYTEHSSSAFPSRDVLSDSDWIRIWIGFGYGLREHLHSIDFN